MACPPQAELVFLDVEEARGRGRAIQELQGTGPHGGRVVFPAFGAFAQSGGVVRVNVGSVRESSSDELQALKKLREQDMEFEICDLPEDVPVRLE